MSHRHHSILNHGHFDFRKKENIPKEDIHKGNGVRECVSLEHYKVVCRCDTNECTERKEIR